MPDFTIGQAAYVNTGTYSATETYDALNTVYFDGGTWVALKSAQGVTPGTDASTWLCITQGIKTLTVAPGASGFATITIVLTDGTPSTANIPVGAVGDGTITVEKLAAAFVLPVAKGGTGAKTAAQALTNLGAQAEIKTAAAVLTVGGWDGDAMTQSITITGIRSSSQFIAQPNNKAGWIAAQDSSLYPPTAGEDTLTFECGSLPTADIPITVYWW